MLLQAKETENGRMLSAKELHKHLGISRNFASWIQGQINKYQFGKNYDYNEVWVHQESGEIAEGENDTNTMATNGYQKDFFISFSMAKELCILENSKLGRRTRKYLITLEDNYIDFLKAKLYLLDEGQIDMEKLSNWQELLDLVIDFNPALQTFQKQMLTLIDHACFLAADMNSAIDGLSGIDNEI